MQVRAPAADINWFTCDRCTQLMIERVDRFAVTSAFHIAQRDWDYILVDRERLWLDSGTVEPRANRILNLGAARFPVRGNQVVVIADAHQQRFETLRAVINDGIAHS